MAAAMLYCAGCNVKHRIPRYDPDKGCACPKCGQPLQSDSDANQTLADGTMDTQGELERHADADPLVGNEFSNYVIVKKLGEGGMGAVYLARHTKLGRDCALKFLSAGLAGQESEHVERFLREARTAAALDHSNVVTVHSIGEVEGQHFIEMEFVKGWSLQDRIKVEGSLRPEEATRIVMEVAGALAAAHERNIVHRDIKPANVMLKEDGAVKVMDFGLARDVSAPSQFTVTGALMGTPYYMSPEQAEGKELDGRSDIYSLGVTYYYMLTGRLPFSGDSVLDILIRHRTEPPPDPRIQRPDLPDGVCQIIRKGLAKDPVERYQTCEEMLGDLERVLGAMVQASDMQTVITPAMGVAVASGAARQLPTGTVTFLFTDIEGSTRLWEQHPDAMDEAISRHHALLGEAIEANAGHVFRTTGDALCAAFATGLDALMAALNAQRALLAEPWSETGPLRVRMALHTGEAQVREGDYFGPPLSRCSRLLAAAHGEQILLSVATADLVRDEPPQEVEIRDLGDCHLRDLTRPEQVFQLVHPDLPDDLPPLRGLESLPNNLPAQATSLVGREKEMAEVRSLLTETRLLTVTGVGGVGKTRLALQVGAALLDEFPDGVWLVELAAMSDPALVPQAVAKALGVREHPGRPLRVDTLLEHLGPKRVLLILDNCEHLIEACAELVDALLRGCPELQLLVTSREALGIGGEVAWRVPSLPTPEPDCLESTEAELASALTQYEAVQLFIERAVAAKPGFTVTNDNAPAVAQVCWRLDGIPLAIELAVARMRVLTPRQIAERLDDRFRLLTGGSRAALPRQRTLRAALDWGHDLLSEKERALLRRLSVFAGGWTLEPAEAVCADAEEGEVGAGGPAIERYEVLDLLSQLVEKSLSVAEEESGEMRYHLLETVRQYGAEKLEEMQESLVMHRKHRDWFVALAECAGEELRGAEQKAWLDRLEREHDNLRAALEYSKREADGVGTGLSLAAVLSRFWHIRGHWSEGRRHLEEMLALEGRPASAGSQATPEDRAERKAARARALNSAGFLAFRQGDYTAARAFHEESLKIRRELGDQRGVRTSLNNLGLVAMDQGDCDAARVLYEEALAANRKEGDRVWEATILNNLGIITERQSDYATAQELFGQSLAIRRELGDKAGIAGSLNNLAVVARHEGDYAGTRELLEESLAIKRELGDKRGVAGSLTNLGIVAMRQGDYAEAQALLEESLETKRGLGDKLGVASSLLNLGLVAESQGDYGRAGGLFEESLAMRRELGEAPGIAECLGGLGRISGAKGEPEQAARLLGSSEALREAINAPLPPDDREEYDSAVVAVRGALGEERSVAAWAAGRAMTMEEAIGYALGAGRTHTTPTACSRP